MLVVLDEISDGGEDRYGGVETVAAIIGQVRFVDDEVNAQFDNCWR